MVEIITRVNGSFCPAAIVGTAVLALSHQVMFYVTQLAKKRDFTTILYLGPPLWTRINFKLSMDK